MESNKILSTSNLLKPSIEDYDNHASDYLLPFADNVALGEINGKRISQEDKLVAGINEVKNFANLSSDDQQLALQFTFREMQHRYGIEYEQGSTGCAAITWLDDKNNVHVVTGNVGDSRALLMILNADNSVSEIKVLNKLHKPTDPDEKKRIEKDKGCVWWGRLNGRLAISRAFGDLVEFKGISHEPEITTVPLSLKEGQKAYLVVACDGLEEGIRDVKTIGEIVAGNTTVPLTTMVNALIAKAYYRSGDNISVGVIAVNTTPTSVAVFDGHGGPNVANNIGTHYFSALEKNIAFVSQPEGRKEAKLILEATNIIFRSARDPKAEPFASIAASDPKHAAFIAKHIDKIHLETLSSLAESEEKKELLELLDSVQEEKNSAGVDVENKLALSVVEEIKLIPETKISPDKPASVFGFFKRDTSDTITKHLTTDMAKSIYEEVTRTCEEADVNALNTLNNYKSPDKLKKALSLLGLHESDAKVQFNGYDGYFVAMKKEYWDSLIKMANVNSLLNICHDFTRQNIASKKTFFGVCEATEQNLQVQKLAENIRKTNIADAKESESLKNNLLKMNEDKLYKENASFKNMVDALNVEFTKLCPVTMDCEQVRVQSHVPVL